MCTTRHQKIISLATWSSRGALYGDYCWVANVDWYFGLIPSMLITAPKSHVLSVCSVICAAIPRWCFRCSELTSLDWPTIAVRLFLHCETELDHARAYAYKFRRNFCVLKMRHSEVELIFSGAVITSITVVLQLTISAENKCRNVLPTTVEGLEHTSSYPEFLHNFYTQNLSWACLRFSWFRGPVT